MWWFLSPAKGKIRVPQPSSHTRTQAARALLHPLRLRVCPVAGSYKERIWEFPPLLKKGTFDHGISENTAGNRARSTPVY